MNGTSNRLPSTGQIRAIVDGPVTGPDSVRPDKVPCSYGTLWLFTLKSNSYHNTVVTRYTRLEANLERRGEGIMSRVNEAVRERPCLKRERQDISFQKHDKLMRMFRRSHPLPGLVPSANRQQEPLKRELIFGGRF